MKNNAVTATILGMLLSGMLLVSALFTALLTYRYISSLRKLQRLQTVVVQINYNRNVMQALANEMVEASKRNPSLEPWLQSIGPKPTPSVPATGAAKPGTK